MPRPLRPLTPDASPTHFVGALLREWRLRLGWSQLGLSLRVGVSASWISRIEKGERAATIELLRRCDQEMRTGGLLARLGRRAVSTRADGSTVADTAAVPGPADSLQPVALVGDRNVDDPAPFARAALALQAAVREVTLSASRLKKLADGLAGAVQRARFDGLSDQQIADHLATLGAPVSVRAALAADRDGTALRFLIASMVAAPSGDFGSDRRSSGATNDVFERA